MSANTFCPNSPQVAGVAGNGESDQIGHRRSADEKPARLRREPKQLLAPAEHNALDMDSDVVAPAAIGVHRRRQHLGDDPASLSSTVHPSKKARMSIAGTVWQDQILKFLVNAVEVLSRGRNRRVERNADEFGSRLPYRALPHSSEEFDGMVERDVRRARKLSQSSGSSDISGSPHG